LAFKRKIKQKMPMDVRHIFLVLKVILVFLLLKMKKNNPLTPISQANYYFIGGQNSNCTITIHGTAESIVIVNGVIDITPLF
jgi:hypothetical protein